MRKKLEPYPGTTAKHMTKCGKLRYDLTTEQEEWILRNYPTHCNLEMAAVSGISHQKIITVAKNHGVAKDPRFTAWLAKEIGRKARKTCERKGIYERMRGRKPSEATLAGLRRYWDEVGIHAYKKLTPKAYEAMRQKKRESRLAIIAKEKMRMHYGLQRKTKIPNIVDNPYRTSQINHRRSALKRGYLLDWDCSEGSAGRYVIYYDDETERSETFERNCVKDGFRVKPA